MPEKIFLPLLAKNVMLDLLCGQMRLKAKRIYCYLPPPPSEREKTDQDDFVHLAPERPRPPAHVTPASPHRSTESEEGSDTGGRLRGSRFRNPLPPLTGPASRWLRN